jgi:hypothetical protein
MLTPGSEGRTKGLFNGASLRSVHEILAAGNSKETSATK